MSQNRSDNPIHSVFHPGDESKHTAVFLHGLFGRGKNFTTIAAGLEPEIDSLLIDLPNHGESQWSEHFSYEEMADAVADHIEQKFENAVDVIGHSMGGKVAMILALRHPELVRKLVIVDIAPVSTDSSSSEFEHLLSSLASLELEGLTKRSDAHEALRAKIPNDTVRGFLLQNLKREGDSFVWQPNLELLYSELPSIMSFPEIQQSAFTGEVLWINGARSEYVKDEDEPKMRKLFPLLQRLTIEGAGHWVHSEKPKEVIAAIREFLLQDD